jgi:phosphoribosylformylglycinamidine cyclo-ligase
VVAGIARGCERAGCALIGGETAEMPGMYPEGEYDLAGFAVGVVEKSCIIDGRDIAPGDVVLGLASSGPHSNGYSLIRRIVAQSGVSYDSDFEGRSLAQTLLVPTRIYCKPVLAAQSRVRLKGLAHITGGGLVENVPRVLPESCAAQLSRGAWQRPAIFDWLQKHGQVADAEMHRVFNCGIGMVVVVAAADAQAACAAFAAEGEDCRVIGHIVERAPGAAACTVA